jgi:hypothetical protein
VIILYGLLNFSHKESECPVPFETPSQNAIQTSQFLIISSLRIKPALLPCLFQSAGNINVCILNSLAHCSPNKSAPLAAPLTTNVILERYGSKVVLS